MPQGERLGRRLKGQKLGMVAHAYSQGQGNQGQGKSGLYNSTDSKKKRVVKSISSLGGTYLILIFRTINVEYRELKVNLTIARLSQKP